MDLGWGDLNQLFASKISKIRYEAILTIFIWWTIAPS